MNNTFAFFTSDKAPFHFPGIHFLIGAVCMLFSLIIIWKVLTREKKVKPEIAQAITGAGKLSDTPVH
jgi:DHA1 family tetracycline resistance protein-like MFS transporter